MNAALDQPHLLADKRRLGAVDDVERPEDRGDVRLYRLLRELELMGDDLVWLAFAEAPQHVDLPIGEHPAAGAARPAAPARLWVADLVEDERRHVEFVVENEPDRRHQRM